jgi:tRNA(adenine34) deaminase
MIDISAVASDKAGSTAYASQDETFMRAALVEARKAYEQQEVPVGAVVVVGNEIIARGHNCPLTQNDPTAHAEMKALRHAGAVMGNYRLTESVLYVTMEPCVMCLGAMVHARIKRLVFGARDPKAGAAGSAFDLTRDSRLNHGIEVFSGILEEPCREIIQEFFRLRRSTGMQEER